MKNQRFKRGLCMMLVALMLLGILATPAMATGHNFTDVRDGQWYSDAVQFVWENNLMTGTDSTTFAPNGTLSRAMLATILWRMEGEPNTDWRNVFTDVASGQWYSSAVVWAFDNGIVTGTSPSTFNPSGNITRQEFAVMMHRYAEFTGQDVSVPSYYHLNWWTDVNAVNSWAMTAMTWAVFTGLITGTGNDVLAPQGNATRAQAAVILVRFANLLDAGNNQGGGGNNNQQPEPPIAQRIDVRDLIGLSLREVLAQYGDLVGEFYTQGGSSSIYWSHPSLPDVGLSFLTNGDMLAGLDRVIFGVISGSACGTLSRTFLFS